MNKKHIKVIFLDIDGVLNGYNKYIKFIADFFYYINKEIWFNDHFDIYKISEYKVKLLKEIIDNTGANIVLCSSWRRQLLAKKFVDMSEEKQRLKLLFKKYYIDIFDGTPYLNPENLREDEIMYWIKNLDSKYLVDKFIILDDEPSLYPQLRNDHLVQTSDIYPDEIIRGICSENSGLKRKHVKKAISLLN